MTNRISSRPRVGFVGAGQLARMSYQASIGLPIDVALLAEAQDESAAQVAADVTVAPDFGIDDLREFAARCDVLTFDHELVDPDQLLALENEGRVLRPSSEVMRVSQNKRLQRERFERIGAPLAPNRAVTSLGEAIEFASRHDWPLVLKSATGGYDGRGVWVIEDESAAAALFTELPDNLELVAEPLLRLDRELAVLVARRPGGEAISYPVVETIQVEGICRAVIAGAEDVNEHSEAATKLALDIADELGVVGIMALELFVQDNQLLVNEIATRPHNSGHFSIEGAACSQFENHLRAVMDWPLGDTSLRAPAVAMVNVIGGREPLDPEAAALLLAEPDLHLHLYGKSWRPGRKLGHVTVLSDDREQVITRAQHAVARLTGEPVPGLAR